TPLVFGGDQEVVNDDFGTVGEVPELCLPSHQRVRRLDRVSVLETEGRVLREERVTHGEKSRRAHARERHELCAVVVVNQCRMAMREGAAPSVLTGKANVRAALDERAERQRFTKGPVDFARLEQRQALCELAFELGVNSESFGRA